MRAVDVDVGMCVVVLSVLYSSAVVVTISFGTEVLVPAGRRTTFGARLFVRGARDKYK